MNVLFWEAFLPNFAATMVGLILGLPIAILVNSMLIASQRRHEAEAKGKLLRDALEVLLSSLRYNQGVLRQIKGNVEQGRVMYVPDIQTHTWDTVAPVLTPLLPNPALLQALSHHWLRLARLMDLNKELFLNETSAGKPRLSSETLRDMWGNVHATTCDLLSHADYLLKQIEGLHPLNGNAMSARGENALVKPRQSLDGIVI